jgi:hypothetical protein
MDFGCCADDGNVVSNDSGELRELETSTESQESFDDQANTLHRDYSEVTPLFRAIELEDWKGILLFLTSGRWSNSPLTSSYNHMLEPTKERQAQTWITCRGKKNELQWRQLPLHAAIAYMAPLPVVQKLVELYHDGIRSADDAGNLPLHLAFGFGAPDNVLAYLIKEYPQALSIKGLQNRRPLDCCDLGPNKARGEIISACQAHTRSLLMKDWDQHWKRSLVDARKRAGVNEPGLDNFNTIEDVFNEFMQLKLELKKTKELAKNRPTMIITKTEPVPPPEHPAHSISRAPSTVQRMLSVGKKMTSKTLRGLKSPSSQVSPSDISSM